MVEWRTGVRGGEVFQKSLIRMIYKAARMDRGNAWKKQIIFNYSWTTSMLGVYGREETINLTWKTSIESKILKKKYLKDRGNH